VGDFPQEFRDRAFGKPDKPFILVLIPALLIICGITFLMSLREAPVVSDKQIVKIQNRYAKLVLDAFEIEKRKKKKEKVKPPPEVKKRVEVPKPEKEEPKPEVKKEEIKIEIPKVIEIKTKKYDIRKEKIEITEREEELKIEALPELPDVLDKKNNRYGSKKESRVIGLDDDLDKGISLAKEGPNIDISRSSRYGGGGRRRSRGLDIEDDKSSLLKSNEPNINTRTIKRYKAKDGGQRRSSSASIVADVDEKKVLLARRAPETKVAVGTRYGGRDYKKKASNPPTSRSITIKEKGAILKKNGKMIALPETASIQNLEACVDPNEEKRLKKKIVTYVGDESICSNKRGSFAYLGTEMFSTLEVRFVSSQKRKYNRCEALTMALQCLINKNKR